MIGGLWFDLALVAVVVAIFLFFYRAAASRSLPALALAGREEGKAVPGTKLRYYPRLARQAGFDPESLRWPYWLAKLAIAALVPLVYLEGRFRLPGEPFVGTILLLAFGGFWIPDLWLAVRRRARVRRIRHGLSYLVDLIVALLYSGLSVDDAFRRAGSEGLDPDHPLAREAGLVGLELETGKNRSEALDALAQRTGVAEMRSLAQALRIGERLGSPVQETLRAQADLLRTKRRQEARRQISLASLRALIPVMLCGLPVFVVLVMFPALVQIFALLREMAVAF